MDRNELIKEVSKYFKIQELVCPHCYNKFGETSWQFISTELLSTLYVLRTKVINKPIIINTWAKCGQFSQRGLRCNMCQLVKNKNNVYLSAHILGKGVDFNAQDLSIADIHNLVKTNIDKFEYPIRLESIESAPTWCHIDVYQPKDSSKNLLEFNG